MKIIYNKKAIDDLQRMEQYIICQFQNEKAAKQITRNIVNTVSLLADNPFMGAKLSDKFGIETKLRFLIVAKQIVFYKTDERSIEIIRVLDSRQDYLSILF